MPVARPFDRLHSAADDGKRARRGHGGLVSQLPTDSPSSSASLRIAVLDRDSGFIQVLSKRLDRLGWEHRVLASPVPPTRSSRCA